MSYAAFGSKNTLATYSSIDAEFSTMPVLAQPSAVQINVHLTELVHELQAVSAIAVAVTADADTRPVPVARITLQDTIAAGRARLLQRRAKLDRDRGQAAVDHVIAVRAKVAV